MFNPKISCGLKKLQEYFLTCKILKFSCLLFHFCKNKINLTFKRKNNFIFLTRHLYQLRKEKYLLFFNFFNFIVVIIG